MAANGNSSNNPSYPEDLNQQSFWNCNLKAYRDKLHTESERLFVVETSFQASVDFLQLENATKGFIPFQVRTNDGMETRMGVWSQSNNSPKCQLAFVHSESSRSKLNITKAMLQTLLSQHQVMPTYLDFIFSFGLQTFKKNFHFSGFRTREMFESHSTVPSTAACKFQMCYNLRSVESTPAPAEWPYSIRQTALFHSFDLTSGDAVWITVKGSENMRNRFRRVTQPAAPCEPSQFSSKVGAFKASLASHLVLCEWSSENWGDYVGFLEDQLQHKTRYALLADVDKPKPLIVVPSPKKLTQTMTEPPPPPTRRFTISEAGKAGFTRAKKLVVRKPGNRKPSEKKDFDLKLLDKKEEKHPEYEDFTYNDLRRIQYVEDETNVALLVVKSNISILDDLKEYYNVLLMSPEFRIALQKDCDAHVGRFTARVKAVISDLKLQQSRLETLLQLIADRKSLLFQLFEHRNMSANKSFTMKAAESADKMETLTEHMREIASRTEQETIFMRIVTLVTLFFLPGTFVATLMSTDIVRFQSNGGLMHQFSWQALVAYLAITVPIMIITFWAAFRYFGREKRKADRAKKRAAELV